MLQIMFVSITLLHHVFVMEPFIFFKSSDSSSNEKFYVFMLYGRIIQSNRFIYFFNKNNEFKFK